MAEHEEEEREDNHDRSNEIEALRRRLAELERKHSSRHRSSRENLDDDNHQSSHHYLQREKAQFRRRPPRRNSSGNPPAFAHLSTSSRRLGQRSTSKTDLYSSAQSIGTSTSGGSVTGLYGDSSSDNSDDDDDDDDDDDGGGYAVDDSGVDDTETRRKRKKVRKRQERTVEFSRDALKSFQRNSAKYSSISLMLNDQGLLDDDIDPNLEDFDGDNEPDDDDHEVGTYDSAGEKTSDSDYAKKGSDDDMGDDDMGNDMTLNQAMQIVNEHSNRSRRRRRLRLPRHLGEKSRSVSLQPDVGDDDEDMVVRNRKPEEMGVNSQGSMILQVDNESDEEDEDDDDRKSLSLRESLVGRHINDDTRTFLRNESPKGDKKIPRGHHQHSPHSRAEPLQSPLGEQVKNRTNPVKLMPPEDTEQRKKLEAQRQTRALSQNLSQMLRLPETTRQKEDDDGVLDKGSSAPLSESSARLSLRQERPKLVPKRTISMTPQTGDGEEPSSTTFQTPVLREEKLSRFRDVRSVSLQPQNGDVVEDDSVGLNAENLEMLDEEAPFELKTTDGRSTPTHIDEEAAMVSYSPEIQKRANEDDNESLRYEDVYTSGRPGAFENLKPIGISTNRPASMNKQSADSMRREQEPCFRQFALLSIQPEQVLLLDNDYLFTDIRHLDCYSVEEVELSDKFPPEKDISLTDLNRFCFPNGLHIRMIPKAGIEGAFRMGWAGANGDRAHIMAFTSESGRTDHGVAITIKWAMNFKRNERQKISQLVRDRRRKRFAQATISRWWRRCVQDRILSEALRISGFETHSPDELRGELTRTEMNLLEKSLKYTNNKNLLSYRSSMRNASNDPIQNQLKGRGVQSKVAKILARNSRPQKTRTPAVHRSSEVEKVTRRALTRSNTTPNSASASDQSLEETEKAPRTRNPFWKHSPLRRRGSLRSCSDMDEIEPAVETGRGPTSETRPAVSDWARAKGIEAYEAMREADRMGHICVVERCYVLIGCRPHEHVLLLGPLQQLINTERNEMAEQRRRGRDRRRNPGDVDDVELERRLVRQQMERRRIILQAMLDKLRMKSSEMNVVYRPRELDMITVPQTFFSVHLNEIPNAPPVKLPLPLPSVGKEWGLAKLLVDVGPDSLVLLVKLLLLERSVLVLGEEQQAVTTCTCALLEILKPFEWASMFMPILPPSMLDYVNSPVPFIAGVVALDVPDVENDDRVLEAMSTGMSLLNLKTKTLLITTERDVAQMLSLDPYLREQLGYLRSRIVEMSAEPKSSLRDFKNFSTHGLSPSEAVTLRSVRLALEGHFTRFCGDLAYNRNAWKRYGTIDAETDKFAFRPDWFINPIRAEQVFQEHIVRTQLFLGYVDHCRAEQAKAENAKKGPVGMKIANWIYQRMTP